MYGLYFQCNPTYSNKNKRERLSLFNIDPILSSLAPSSSQIQSSPYLDPFCLLPDHRHSYAHVEAYRPSSNSIQTVVHPRDAIPSQPEALACSHSWRATRVHWSAESRPRMTEARLVPFSTLPIDSPSLREERHL